MTTVSVRSTRYYWWVTLPNAPRGIPILKGVGQAHLTEPEAIAKAERIAAARAVTS